MIFKPGLKKSTIEASTTYYVVLSIKYECIVNSTELLSQLEVEKNMGTDRFCVTVLVLYFIFILYARSICSVFHQIQYVFGHLLESKLQYYIPEKFWKVFKLWGQGINIREQQDALDFYQAVIDQVDEQVKVNIQVSNQWSHRWRFLTVAQKEKNMLLNPRKSSLAEFHSKGDI